jgi:hypothetical protein
VLPRNAELLCGRTRFLEAVRVGRAGNCLRRSGAQQARADRKRNPKPEERIEPHALGANDTHSLSLLPFAVFQLLGPANEMGLVRRSRAPHKLVEHAMPLKRTSAPGYRLVAVEERLQVWWRLRSLSSEIDLRNM